MFNGRNAVAPQKIIILRSLQFGDLMCAVPAFRALRSALPTTEITLLGLPWAEEFANRFHHYLDRHICFPGFPGFPEHGADIHAIPTFLARIQAEQFDLALQMHGSGSLSNSIVALLGAKQMAGYYVQGNYCPDGDTFMPYPQRGHEIHRLLALVEFLGLIPTGQPISDRLEFPLNDCDWREYEDLRSRYALDADTVVIHPGARAAERRWPVEKFAAVGDLLAAAGYQVLLTGTQGERDIAWQVQARMAAPAVNLCGETGYGALGVLLAASRLLVSNDTGVSHVAAALGVPSVILFSASEPERWAPLDQNLHRRIENAASAEPMTVYREAAALLERNRQYAT